MIAQVIVNSPAKQTDKKFDYLIPQDLEDRILIGTRVSVPFGIGNKHLEGYVAGISAHSSAKKLKAIIDAEQTPVFDEKMLELIEWMREKYLCTYMDAIKVIIPSGTSVKKEEWFVLNEVLPKPSEKEKRIIDIVKDNGGAAQINYIRQFFEEENITPALKKLCDKGVFIREFRDNRSVRDKTVRIARLAISPEEVSNAVSMLLKSRAYAQAKVLDVLSSCDIISVSDLQYFTECSYNTITTLKKRGLIEFDNIVVSRTHKRAGEITPTTPPPLTMEQESVCGEIQKALLENRFSEHLLHGVTGSGKTEVFMNAIKSVTDTGRQAIVLVPEISLTPQMMERFIARFGERVAVFHSGLSLGERYDEWKKMREKKADIVIGARSAIFAPFDNIGIIIMDEEHEGTYKSEMLPRYDTREVARFRATQNGCTLLLASATPDIRTYFNADNKKINILKLKTRVNKNPIPDVKIVDMRNELNDGNKSVFSKALLEEIEKNLKDKEQTILLMNRRGFSTFVSCRNCGFVATCPNCNISLTYHRYNNLLKCHYCGHTVANYELCPECGSKYIRYFGGGTQKIEEEIKKIFPDATTIRMDVDTTSGQNSHERLLNEFSQKNIDILIGTQMIAKGLDFPNVTLVGVVSADTVLNIDDYRSAERAFDLLEQVSGRAGRAHKRGRAVIQTYSPEHNSVVCAAKHDYDGFYNNEIEIRKLMHYPPFCEMITVLFSGAYENLVAQCARLFAKYVSESGAVTNDVKLLGPIPAAIAKIKNKYRWRLLIKCNNADNLSQLLISAREKCRENKNFEKVTIVIDKNPNNIY